MPEPKKKLNAEQKKKLNSYIDQLAFRNSVIKDYNKKGINILDKKFQNINFDNDTIVKISRTHLGDNKRIYSYNIDKKFDQYNKLSGRVELSNETKKRKNVLGTSYQTDTKIIKYKVYLCLIIYIQIFKIKIIWRKYLHVIKIFYY